MSDNEFMIFVIKKCLDKLPAWVFEDLMLNDQQCRDEFEARYNVSLQVSPDNISNMKPDEVEKLEFKQEQIYLNSIDLLMEDMKKFMEDQSGS